MKSPPWSTAFVVYFGVALCACGVNTTSRAGYDSGAAAAEPNIPLATEQVPAAAPTPAAPTPQPNVILDGNAAEPNAAALLPVEPTLGLGRYNELTVVVAPPTAAAGVPLTVDKSADHPVGGLSLYANKLYGPSGCIARQHRAGGYLVLRPCDDANVSLWNLFYGATYARSASNPNSDDWRITACLSGTETCYASLRQGQNLPQTQLNVVHTWQRPQNSPQGVLVHLIAEPNSCLADDGNSTPRVQPCDPGAKGQLWTMPLLTGQSGPPLSGRGRCLVATADARPTLVACDSQAQKSSQWYVDQNGSFGTWDDGDRLHLAYDGKTRLPLFFKPGTSGAGTPVWGFGPYPQQLRGKTP